MHIGKFLHGEKRARKRPFEAEQPKGSLSRLFRPRAVSPLRAQFGSRGLLQVNVCYVVVSGLAAFKVKTREADVQDAPFIHEDRVRVEGKSKAPDYAFRIGGTRKFQLEAKKPAINIGTDAAAAFQIRRYSKGKDATIYKSSNGWKLRISERKRIRGEYR